MDAFETLREAPLTSVEFVHDYLQVHFEDTWLTLYVWPDISDADGIGISFGEPGYRDALCSLIGESVSHAEWNEGRSLTIEFENGHVLLLSLRDEERDVAEAGSLSIPGEPLVIL